MTPHGPLAMRTGRASNTKFWNLSAISDYRQRCERGRTESVSTALEEYSVYADVTTMGERSLTRDVRKSFWAQRGQRALRVPAAGELRTSNNCENQYQQYHQGHQRKE